jgi:prepilin-type N-terminal cleavage/methylation domain-containing protein
MLSTRSEAMLVLKSRRVNGPTKAPVARWCPAFSLVEMLAVVVIISLLLVVVVPRFSDASDQARRSSREITKACLRQARAHAISSGTATAVAIPSLESDPALGGRALALVEVELDEGRFVPLAGEGRILQRQQTLPGNYHFVRGADLQVNVPTLMDTPSDMSCRFGSVQASCHTIVFSPDGRIVWPAAGTPINLGIARATRSGGGLQLTQRNQDRPVFELFQVNRLTGRTRDLEP